MKVLSHVGVFLQRSELSYTDLLELLDTRYINKAQALVIESTDPDDPLTCDVAKLAIKGLDELALSRINRFLRLRRRLGWKIAEPDKAIAAFNAELDDAFLLKLSQIERLRADLKLPLNQLLSFWANIGTDGKDSLYIKLFQNKVVVNPVDTTFSLRYSAPLSSLPGITFPPDSLKDKIAYDDAAKQLRFVGSMTADERTLLLSLSPNANYQRAVEQLFQMRQFDSIELAIVGTNPDEAKISKHAPTILAALRIGSADLSLLTGSEVSQEALNLPSEVNDDQLNLKNLSHLYRIVSFARALRLPVRDFLALRALTGLNPFDPTDLDQTRQFVERVRKVRASRFRVAELDYLLRHVSQATSGVAPMMDSVDLVLKEIHDGLNKIIAETTVILDATGAGTDPTGELTGKALAAVLQAKDPVELTNNLNLVMAVLDGTSKLTKDEQRSVIETHLAPFLPNIEEAKTKLVGVGEGDPELASKENRFGYVLPPLMDYLRKIQSESLIKQKLSEALKLEVAAVETLTKVFRAQVDSNQNAIADFRPLPNAAYQAYLKLSEAGLKVADEAQQGRQRTIYLRLHKAAIVINALKITVASRPLPPASQAADGQSFDELSWLVTQNPNAGWLDFNALPLDPAPSGQPLSDTWERLVDLFQLRDRLPAGKAALFELFRMDASGTNDDGKPIDFLVELSDRTGWALDDLQQLAGPQGWFTASFAALALDERLLRLKTCFDVLKRLGMAAEKVLLWTGLDVSPNEAPDVSLNKARETASSIKSAVKAKYDAEQWTTVAKPLREKQRAALVAFLVWKRDYENSNRLFAEYLVDVEMDPCQMTSRIKQAIGSVQTFVQRCFLNLEEKVTLDEDAAREWKWMKNYRVWEANRKVFLYPEKLDRTGATRRQDAFL